MLLPSAWRPAMLAGLALIPALALTSAPAAAQAADGDVEVHSLAVNYGDLDLSTIKGRARLDERVRAAAAKVCTPDSAGVAHTMVDSRCYHVALTGARHKLAQLQQDRQLVRR